MGNSQLTVISEEQLQRIRQLCAAWPGVTEKLSHGEPTFFIGKKVFAMSANNHHHDGRIAVWLPVPPGMQAMLIEAAPEKFFKPPYVGGRGWVGVELAQVSDEELTYHLQTAYRQIASKKLLLLLEASLESKP